MQHDQLSEIGSTSSYLDSVDDRSIVEELIKLEEMQMNAGGHLGMANQVDDCISPHGSMVHSVTVGAGGQTALVLYHSFSEAAGGTPVPSATLSPTQEVDGILQPNCSHPDSHLLMTTPVAESPLCGGSSCQVTPAGTPLSSCSSSIPPSPVDGRHNFFTPIHSGGGGHAVNVVLGPTKPMQRPTATLPNKVAGQVEWLGLANGSMAMGRPPPTENKFHKSHAFAVSAQSQMRPYRQGSEQVSNNTVPQNVQHSQHRIIIINTFAVPAPLDGKCGGNLNLTQTYRCQHSPAAQRQRTLSGSNSSSRGRPRLSTGALASPYNPEVHKAVLCAQHQQQTITPTRHKIDCVLLSKLDNPTSDFGRGMGINNASDTFTARRNLTELLESAPLLDGPSSLHSPSPLSFKPGYYGSSEDNIGDKQIDIEM
uniref:Uncharacterized protein n=1 Tax=Eptatretus burgeri TaxID=7764 RepID=A0A8C4QCT9_EPTBU